MASPITPHSNLTCPFSNDRAEIPDHSHSGHRVVDANKRDIRQTMPNLAEAPSADKPRQLADERLLVVEQAPPAISQTLAGRKVPFPQIVPAAGARVRARAV